MSNTVELNIPKRKNGVINKLNKICLQCGVVFKVWPYRHKKAQFCSHQCAYKSSIVYQKVSKALTGRKLSKQHIENCKKGRRKFKEKHGFLVSPEARIKIANKLRGKNSPHWKGGITPLFKSIRDSVEYSLWREAVFKRDNYTCQICKDNKGGNLEADHIKSFAYFPELRFAIDNGRTLCKTCHKLTDNWGWKSYHQYKKQILCQLELLN